MATTTHDLPRKCRLSPGQQRRPGGRPRTVSRPMSLRDTVCCHRPWRWVPKSYQPPGGQTWMWVLVTLKCQPLQGRRERTRGPIGAPPAPQPPGWTPTIPTRSRAPASALREHPDPVSQASPARGHGAGCAGNPGRWVPLGCRGASPERRGHIPGEGVVGESAWCGGRAPGPQTATASPPSQCVTLLPSSGSCPWGSVPVTLHSPFLHGPGTPNTLRQQVGEL